MSRRPPTLAELEDQVRSFNKRWPVGQKVSVRLDDGSGIVTRTTAEAQVLSGHSAVIFLADVRGCYLLNRVTPLGDDD